MASLSPSTNLFPQPFNRKLQTKLKVTPSCASRHETKFNFPSSSANNNVAIGRSERGEMMRREIEWEKLKKKEEKERKEEVNKKIASQKAISVILRREATKAVIEKKRGPTNSKKLLPQTVLEALHERITALRWASALEVFELLREQLWYRPYAGMYVKLIVMLGKCKQPDKALQLFQDMIDEGCAVTHESYTALLSAYGRSVFAFDKVQDVLSDMESLGIRPNTVTYNTLIDAYGKAKMFAEMEATLMEMLSQKDCEPDVWTMNSTIRAFGGSGQIEMMENCYEKFQSAGIEPNIKTFNILLDSYGKAGNYQKMSAVMEYMQRYHYSWTIVTYNVVIDAFGRAG
ncbi:hypothetical protein OIU78_011044 [Salix suchowensis]|nr:hypothetical protein OIU78_011044 [Salix suchowensis]